MKKQFTIKTAQTVKSITKSASKSELTNLLKFEPLFGKSVCCDYMLDFVALPKPVFSL